MTEAAIDTGLFRDLYVALGDPLDETTWIMRFYYKPFISWIWGGCLIMAGGGLLALFDRRYRAHRRQAGRNPAAAAAGPYTPPPEAGLAARGTSSLSALCFLYCCLSFCLDFLQWG